MTLDPHADVIVTTILMGQPVHEPFKTMDLKTGRALQELVAARLAPPLGGVAGFKMVWNRGDAQEALGLDAPEMARVFSKGVHKDKATISLNDYRHLAVEAHIVARLSASTELGVTYDRERIASHVGGFSAAIEIQDLLQAPGSLSPGAALAHNAFGVGAVVAGRTIPAPGFNTARITTRILHGDGVIAEGSALAPEDPFDMVADVANHFGEQGTALKNGQFIFCGSHIPTYAIDRPGAFGVSMMGLGEAWLSVTEAGSGGSE